MSPYLMVLLAWTYGDMAILPTPCSMLNRADTRTTKLKVNDLSEKSRPRRFMNSLLYSMIKCMAKEGKYKENNEDNYKTLHPRRPLWQQGHIDSTYKVSYFLGKFCIHSCTYSHIHVDTHLHAHSLHFFWYSIALINGTQLKAGLGSEGRYVCCELSLVISFLRV